MTVYVDKLPGNGWGRWNGGAHMLGSDLDELHALAARIGLRRSWFQDDSTFAHYDLTASKRALALRHGATEIGAGEIPDDVLMRCDGGGFEPRYERMARLAAKSGEPRVDSCPSSRSPSTGTPDPSKGS